MISSETSKAAVSYLLDPSANAKTTAASSPGTSPERLQEEFDRWAREGWGADLEIYNRSLLEIAAALTELKQGAKILDLSCGSGLAARLIAERAAKEAVSVSVTGVDISEGMLKLARNASSGYRNIDYVVGSAENIPAPDQTYDGIICVEAFYYYADQDRALDEIRRVLKPKGLCYLLLRLYSDNPYSGDFLTHLAISVHIRSVAEYTRMVCAHGLEVVRCDRLPERKTRQGGLPSVLARALRIFAQHPAEWAPAIKRKVREAQRRDKARAGGALLLVIKRP